MDGIGQGPRQGPTHHGVGQITHFISKINPPYDLPSGQGLILILNIFLLLFLFKILFGGHPGRVFVPAEEKSDGTLDDRGDEVGGFLKKCPSKMSYIYIISHPEKKL